MILLDPLARPIIGHRGNRAHAPENTIPSMLEAVALGVDALEFDVHVSADGVLMVIHDPTLLRTTGEPGTVASLRAADVTTCDAGACFTTDGGRTFPWRGRGATVPTFDDVIDALPPSLPLIIELKTPAATAALDAAIRRHGLQERVIVAGFDAASTRPLRGHGVALGASTPDVARLLVPALLRRPVRQRRFDALCIPPTHNGFPLPVASLARAVRPLGVVTHIWTINDPGHARRLWQCGVQGIISDDPAILFPVRDALKR